MLPADGRSSAGACVPSWTCRACISRVSRNGKTFVRHQDPISGSFGSMVDVILPVLNEAEAIPWVPGRLPPGSTHRGGQRFHRRLGGHRRGLGARWSSSRCAASVPRAGPVFSQQPVRRCASWTATGHSTPRHPVRHGTRRSGTAELVMGRRQPGPGGLASARPAGEPLPGPGRLAAVWGHDPDLDRCGPPARQPAGAGDRRPALRMAAEMVLRAADAGWRMREVPVDYLLATALEGDRHGPGDLARGQRHATVAR